jgi:hypothetical protein
MKLQIWWIPQVPMKSFNVPVSSIKEARLVLDTLAMYDLFQYENKVKSDYTNAGGLQYWDEEEKEWLDWYDEETGDDFDKYCINKGMNWDIANKIRQANAER